MRPNPLSLIRWASVDLARRRLRSRVTPEALRAVLDAPLPPRDRPVREVSFLALDFETTGLDPRRDRIVSAGWVQIRAGAVHLGTAREILVRPDVELDPRSVVIHGIGDDRASGGMDEGEMVKRLLEALPGQVLVGHHVGFDKAFLAGALRRILGGRLPLLSVDTLEIERRIRRSRSGGVPPLLPEESGDYDLSSVRRLYGLPERPAHGALADSLSVAELLLAQCAHLRQGMETPLASLW